MIRNFADIDDQVQKIKEINKKTIAVAAAQDEHILEAVCEAKKLGIADAILVGDSEKIKEISEQHHLDISQFQIIHRESVSDAAEKAVELVREGTADILLKGLLDSSVYLKAVLNKEKGLKSSQLLSYVTVFEVPGFDRLFILTDPGLNLEPTLEEKEVIMLNAVNIAHALGNPFPKVGFVCPIEKVNSKMNSTLDAKTLVEKYSGSTDFMAGGPFGLDNAVLEESARIKGITDPVAGKADILIFNDIGVGNGVYKTLMCFSHCKNAGIIIGATAPVLMVSRADNADAKLNSIKLGVLLSDYIKK